MLPVTATTTRTVIFFENPALQSLRIHYNEVPEGKEENMIHVRYEGHSYDFREEEVDVGDLSTDAEVRNAVAGALSEVSSLSVDQVRNKLRDFAIDRGTPGELTLRPQAVFG